MGSKFDNDMISWLLASCFEHKIGSHGDDKQLIEDHDSDMSICCAPNIDNQYPSRGSEK